MGGPRRVPVLDKRRAGLVEFLIEEGVGEATDVLIIEEARCGGCDNGEKAGAVSFADGFMTNGRTARSSRLSKKMWRPASGSYSTNANVRPSGDEQPGTSTRGLFVSRSSAPLPSAGFQNRFGGPPRLALKMTCPPSLVHTGESPPSKVSCVRAFRAIS